MIVDTLFPLPIQLLDGGRWTHPPPEEVADGPPRYARVTCNQAWDVSGRLVYKAPTVPFDHGWFDMIHTMGIYPDTVEIWRSLCLRLVFLFDTHLPTFEQHDLATAWVTRDAVGWTKEHDHQVERLIGTDGQTVWPWMWLRPRTSAHQHAQRIQRFQSDVAWMAATTAHRSPTL